MCFWHEVHCGASEHGTRANVCDDSGSNRALACLPQRSHPAHTIAVTEEPVSTISEKGRGGVPMCRTTAY